MSSKPTAGQVVAAALDEVAGTATPESRAVLRSLTTTDQQAVLREAQKVKSAVRGKVADK